MAKIRDFVDQDRPIQMEYFDFLDALETLSEIQIEKKLRKMILKDPYFFDPYMNLYQLLQEQDQYEEAEILLDYGFGLALNLILDDDGSWPDEFLWGFTENRHILRIVYKKAIGLWIKLEFVMALDLFRKLFSCNPEDQLGARYLILAIRKNMTFEEYDNKFDSDSGGLQEEKWFQKFRKEFPEEFEE
ncbi:hypothetical protein LEP1GSC060_1859 [Leptospira weilii serovar Ranarum str. ICFT]|uniref:Tetratricopeptide repeat protein n=1 Tax=Leptospira weilii serovar Ranarum str. ICFT TaxID=1218598 RepID=N1WLP0_9LEPT|nr:hypothetical protein [Leptospira weilii]EMY78069.1 hypothetical protein LEP1GSC060_1859 [Leptospira weilii serovar Ranarum str. ICFT]